VILSLDASTASGSVALIGKNRTVREILVDVPRGRGGALFRALQEMLRETPPISRVTVGVGPGSYNGIRSAIAVAWGLATARNIPLIGISSLLGLDEGSYCAVGDARRGQYYLAHVSCGILENEPALLSKEGLVAALQQSPARTIFAPGPIDFLEGVIIRTPSAARLAFLGAGLHPNWPQPIYLKPPHITTPKEASG
jgi:tRNA threonylcarbamoyladenosine biosynthesis protein TsaB